MFRYITVVSFFGVLGAFAQTPDPGPRFEVAEIHRSASAPNPYTWASGGALRGPRYDFRKATLMDLIRAAYGVDPNTIVGGPNWLEFDRFDVAAKAPPNTPPSKVRAMLQELLADRFKLVQHKDTRLMPAFALSLSGNKSKLKQSDGMGESGCTYQPQPGVATFNFYICRNVTMDAFARQLRGFGGDYLTVPVENATGLDGSYDFELRWNWRSQVMQAGAERTTIFDAVEKQLGLTLGSTKTPLPVIVIDRVNENPTPNAPDIASKLPPREVEFEVADLKVNRGNEQSYIGVTPGGGFEARNQSMKILLATGWDLDWDHVDEGFANLPKWVDSAKLDIHAKPASATNGPPGGGFVDDEGRLMLRNLLTERFQMKTHVENRPRDAYTLVMAKPKIKKADPSNRASCKESRTIANDPRDKNPLLARLISCQNVTMGQFASSLHGFAADYILYDVEDATGMSGTYDFTLSYTPRYLLKAPASAQNAGGEPAASDPGGGLSLGDAISKQLGLKLVMRKRLLPVEVIDRMEEKPLQN